MSRHSEVAQRTSVSVENVSQCSHPCSASLFPSQNPLVQYEANQFTKMMSDCMLRSWEICSRGFSVCFMTLVA